MEKKKESKTGLIISTILVILIAGVVIWYMKPWQTTAVEEPVAEATTEATEEATA